MHRVMKRLLVMLVLPVFDRYRCRPLMLVLLAERRFVKDYVAETGSMI